MKDAKLRKAINQFGKDNELQILLLENPSFDKSIVGITEDGRLIYDYNKMVEEMSKEDHIDVLESMEFIDYNTLRSLPYMGENAPIIMSMSKDDLLERI